MSKIISILTLVLLLPLSHASASSSAAFAGLKALQGEWKAKEDGSRVTFELASDGHALIENLMGMVNVYHLDGDSVMVTHYCSEGNQPRLRAEKFSSPLAFLDFQYVDITNLEPGQHHISGLKIEFLGVDHVRETWTANGHSGQPTIIDLERVK